MQFAGWLPTPQLLPILIYEDNVNMDSGASDHMHPDRAQLTNVVPYFTDVILPKGANINVIEAGTLLVSCLNLLHKVRHIIPLLNTLHVPGLRTTLWSVIKFAQCGHTIIFGDSTIRIIMHDGRLDSFELRLSHPFYQPRDHPFGYCTQASANCVTTINPPSTATDSVVRAPYARTPKIVTLTQSSRACVNQSHSCRQRSRRLGGRHRPLRTLVVLY